jgi:lipopolysaccharide/colanic/teichoic acid biosynthesis glycosyltransferase
MKHLGSKAKIRIKLLTVLLIVMICLGVPALADGIFKSADLPMSYIYTPSGIALLAMIQWKWRHYDRIREGIGFGYYLTKRFIDIALALFLLVLSSPVSLVIALLVYMENDGPIIFKRMAIGRYGKIFPMFKFRTMIDGAEQALAENEELKKIYYSNCKIENDPRVTKLGRILRKTSLDEIPQLFNVLLGHMTFVGPRPIAEDEVAIYGPAVEKFKMVTPGITGLWQTSGRSETSYERRVELDMLYIEKRSILFDIWILLKTIPAVLLKRGAV